MFSQLKNLQTKVEDLNQSLTATREAAHAAKRNWYQVSTYSFSDRDWHWYESEIARIENSCRFTCHHAVITHFASKIGLLFCFSMAVDRRNESVFSNISEVWICASVGCLFCCPPAGPQFPSSPQSIRRCIID